MLPHPTQRRPRRSRPTLDVDFSMGRGGAGEKTRSGCDLPHTRPEPPSPLAIAGGAKLTPSSIQPGPLQTSFFLFLLLATRTQPKIGALPPSHTAPADEEEGCRVVHRGGCLSPKGGLRPLEETLAAPSTFIWHNITHESHRLPWRHSSCRQLCGFPFPPHYPYPYLTGPKPRRPGTHAPPPPPEEDRGCSPAGPGRNGCSGGGFHDVSWSYIDLHAISSDPVGGDSRLGGVEFEPGSSGPKIRRRGNHGPLQFLLGRLPPHLSHIPDSRRHWKSVPRH